MPASAEDRDHVARIISAIFGAPQPPPARTGPILATFWNAGLSPARVLATAVQHLPAAPPWFAAPPPPAATIASRAAAMFDELDRIDGVRVDIPATMAYRLAYWCDDSGIPGPPPGRRP